MMKPVDVTGDQSSVQIWAFQHYLFSKLGLPCDMYLNAFMASTCQLICIYVPGLILDLVRCHIRAMP